MSDFLDLVIDKLVKEEQEFKPKKRRTRKLKYPCSICSKSVLNNQKAVQCDPCDLWVHIKCEGISNDTYSTMMIENEDEICEPWHCLVCRVITNKNNFPFTFCDDVDLENLQNSSLKFYLKFLNSLTWMLMK